VGPGEFVNQDTLVANTQRSIGLNLADFLGTKVPALFGSSLSVVRIVC